SASFAHNPWSPITADSSRWRARAASAARSANRLGGLEIDHQLELGRSWAYRPHPEASFQPWLRWFGAFCDFLEAASGGWVRFVVASLVDAFTAMAVTSS